MSKKTISDISAADGEAGRQAAVDDEAPELDRSFFEGARLRIGKRILREATGTYTKRGRPPAGERAKVQQSLRLSPEVIEHFRAGGAGWQRRIDEVLKRHVREAEAGSGVAEDRAGYRSGEGAKSES